jgi:DNA-binding beta-propeller fold protein YncE
MRRPLTRLTITAALAAALGACPENNGTDPPTDRFFFPTALALHRPSVGARADYLYVINSDFDLAYNGSTVTQVALAPVNSLRAQLAAANETCRATPAMCNDKATVNVQVRAGEAMRAVNCIRDIEARDAWICPDIPLVLKENTRKLNPYAVEAALAVYPRATVDVQRLYVIVRGGNSLAWFDIDANGVLDCGPADERGYCSATHYAGNDPSQSNSTRDVLPQESSQLSIDPSRGWIVMTHQSYATDVAHASLLFDPLGAQGTMQTSVPRLVSPLGGIATGLSSLVLLPRNAPNDRSTWLATSRAEAVFTLLQAYDGTLVARDSRSFLYRAAAAPVTGLNTGTNNRAIVLDPAPGASSQRAYVISRSPESLLTVDISNPSVPTVTDATAIPQGPSRLAAVWHPSLGRTYVYTVSYDTRWIYVVDPSEHRVVAQIATHRGPHNLTYDEVDGMLYVVDFLDSAIEVIDLRPEVNGAANPMFNRRALTFGRPGRGA